MNSDPQVNLALYRTLFAVFAFITGSMIGSFLNVCIYRLPLGLSVNDPKRSFCPSCKRQIPWSENLPLISWLALGGKCSGCKSPISIRYFGVELITGILFLLIWLRGPWDVALVYWVFLSLLIVATFIDFEHFIIPDEITKGGTVAGVLLCTLHPAVLGESVWWRAGLAALGGAAVGYAILFGVVEFGKMVFGKKKIALAKPEPLEWKLLGEDGEFRIGNDVLKWSDLFFRPTDKMILRCPSITIEDCSATNATVVIQSTEVCLEGRIFDLEKVAAFRGTVQEVVIPREAMGGGDVKFIACIGAFLGWQAVIFTIIAASVVGAVIGSITIAMGRRELSAKIPFGPYLALGALAWIFAGPEIVVWYLGLLRPEDGAY